MEIIYKLEDFVVNQMFRHYACDFIDAEMYSYLFNTMQKTIESKLRKRPELIMELLEEMPETKEHVFARIARFGGIKFYKYLNQECELIKYIKANIKEEGLK